MTKEHFFVLYFEVTLQRAKPGGGLGGGANKNGWLDGFGSQAAVKGPLGHLCYAIAQTLLCKLT